MRRATPASWRPPLPPSSAATPSACCSSPSCARTCWACTRR
nr:MAG: hypothetical protein [Molluscum contagiosum virus]